MKNANPGAPVTELMVASSRGDYDAVRGMLAADPSAAMNARDRFGNTALMYAAGRGHTGIIRLLLAAGADVNMQNQVGATAVDLAASYGHWRTMQLLVGHGAEGVSEDRLPARVNLNPADRMLLDAAWEGDLRGVEKLLARGADAEARMPGGGWTALMIAAIKGHASVVGCLLSHGAEVDARSADGWNALRFAGSLGDVEIMRMLLGQGADPNAQDQDGWTTLMEAARENHRATVEVMLSHGADTALLNRQGETALAIARRHGNTEMVTLLEAPSE